MIGWTHAGLGALTGLAIGLTGVGGGAFMAPALILWFGVEPHTAIATDLWFAILTKLVAVKAHHGEGQVDWQVVRRLWWGSVPVACLVVLLVGHGVAFGKPEDLIASVGVLVIVTGLGLLMAPRLLKVGRMRRLGSPERFKAVQPVLTVMGGAGLGFCVALTSIGAGALGSVLLLYLYPLRMTPHRLVATDIAHAIPLALVAGLGYLWAGKVDGWLLLDLLAGSLPAVLVGSVLSRRIPGRWMQILLAILLLVAGMKVLKGIA
ncbi:sulfite exporter TauE/SafE family protein [Ferrovum sp.]|uniref:sulfite exporter TauE/SafE family protein n=1 Tax=Ferrovum sp. TaxID=2609467 RepID=UPI0026119E82|nr:sulfite exporter TauE/SafE family protein [Ferrovum sp.]